MFEAVWDMFKCMGNDLGQGSTNWKVEGFSDGKDPPQTLNPNP